MKLIQKNESNIDFIKNLYNENKVIFEKTVLISDNLKYVICYFPQHNFYHIFIYDYIDNFIISNINFSKLSNSTLKYFNMIKGDIYNDWLKNSFRCLSHIIGYYP